MSETYYKVKGVVVEDRVRKKHDKQPIAQKRIEIGEEFKPGSPDPSGETPIIRYYTSFKIYSYEPDHKNPYCAHIIQTHNPASPKPVFSRITRKDGYKLGLMLINYFNDNKEKFDAMDKLGDTYLTINETHQKEIDYITKNKDYIDEYFKAKDIHICRS